MFLEERKWNKKFLCLNPRHSFFQSLALDSIKTHHYRIVRCSAVTGENLLQGMDWLLEDIGARIFTLD